MPKIIDDAENIILDTAKKVFIEEGYNNASMRKIAKASGVSSGTLYTYFENKETLFCHVALRLNLNVFGAMVKELSKIIEPESYIRKYIELSYYNYYKLSTNVTTEIINSDVEVTLIKFLEESVEWQKIQLGTFKGLEDSIKTINPQLSKGDILRLQLMLHTLSTSFVRRFNDEDDEVNIDFIYRVIMSSING